MAGGGGCMLTMFAASLLHLVCEWTHGRRWCMHADHVHFLPVARGFIGSEWTHVAVVHADHVCCLPFALGFIA
ncbi:hypothetical protein EDD15DRAFT_2238686, partial [Pisolithus albus]